MGIGRRTRVLLGLLACLLLAGLILVPYQLARSRQAALHLLEQRFGLRLAVERVEMTLLPLPRLVLRQARVAGPPGFGETPLLEIPEVTVRLAPLPLLLGHATPSTVVLVEPVVTLVRGPDGTWNWGEALPIVRKPITPVPLSEEGRSPGARTGWIRRFLPASLGGSPTILIRRGRVMVRGFEIPVVGLEEIEGRATVANNGIVRFALSTQAENPSGGRARVEGTVWGFPTQPQVDLRGELVSVDLGSFPVVRGLMASGPADIRVTLKGTSGGLAVKAEISLTGAAVRWPGRFQKAPGDPAELRLSAEVGREVIHVQEGVLRLGKYRLELSGDVGLRDGFSRLFFRVPRSALDQLSHHLPWLTGAVAGEVEAEVVLTTGPRLSAPIRAEGRIGITKGRWQPAAPLPAVHRFSGVVRLTGGQARIEGLRFSWGAAQILVKGLARWRGPRPGVALHVTAHHLDLDPLLAYLAGSRPVLASAGIPGRPKTAVASERAAMSHRSPPIPSPLPGRFSVEGFFSVEGGRVAGLPFTRLRAQLLRLGPVWYLQGVRLQLAEGGEQMGYVSLNTGAPHPAGTLYARLSDLPIAPMLPFLKLGNLIDGRLDGEMELRWRGLAGEEVRRSLRGVGSLQITGGRVQGALLGEGVRQMGLLPGRPLTFRTLSASYTVGRGVVVSDDVRVQEGPWQISARGQIDLNGVLDFFLTADHAGEPPLAARLLGPLWGPRLAPIR